MSCNGAIIRSIEEGSPADDAGFVQGCMILAVNGFPVRDLIDWRWHTSEDFILITYRDLQGDEGVVELERSFGESWGIEFEGVVFDGIRQCRNACCFCFMRQLPDNMRSSLSLRDDDYRLSFLQGTFVTLTNSTPEEELRIIDQHITPLHVSLHAISPDVRKKLMGKHAQHGLDVCKRLLDAGIEMRMQIVLVPGANDGEELEKSLTWAYDKPGILSVGIVPLGFTCHQSLFDKSYNSRDDSIKIIETLVPFQKRALEEKQTPWVFAADEFYRNAFRGDLLRHLPPADFYGNYEMFEDGIGIIRFMVDEWLKNESSIFRLAEILDKAATTVHFVMGYAQVEHFSELVYGSPLKGKLLPLVVSNKYFGGNVDVTGLLCGCDIIKTIQEIEHSKEPLHLVVVPDVILNDDGVTLDDMSVEDIQNELNTPFAMVSCNPSEYLDEIAMLVEQKILP